MGPRVLLVGAVGTNLGDEAIARAIHAAFQPEFEVLTTHFGTLPEPQPIPFLKLDRRSPAGVLRLARAMRGSTAVVVGGGTLIQDKLGFSLLRGLVPLVFQATLLARFLRKPVLFAPIGADALRDRRAMAMARKSLRRAMLVLARDPDSLGRIRHYAPDVEDRLVLSGDPAFLLQGDGGQAKRTKVVISLVKEDLDPRPLLESFTALIRHLLETTDHDVLLLAMDCRDDEEAVLNDALSKAFEPQPRLTVLGAPTLEVAMRELRGAAVVVAMRLHAAILAAGHAPVVGISRSEKTDSIFGTLGIPFQRVESMRAQALIGSTMAALGSSSLVEVQRERAAEQAQRARSGLERLKDLLLQGPA